MGKSVRAYPKLNQPLIKYRVLPISWDANVAKDFSVLRLNFVGPLNFTDGSIEMDSRWFAKVPQLYKIMIEIRKDTRTAKNSLLLDVVNGKPPLMDIV